MFTRAARKTRPPSLASSLVVSSAASASCVEIPARRSCAATRAPPRAHTCASGTSQHLASCASLRPSGTRRARAHPTHEKDEVEATTPTSGALPLRSPPRGRRPERAPSRAGRDVRAPERAAAPGTRRVCCTGHISGARGGLLVLRDGGGGGAGFLGSRHQGETVSKARAVFCQLRSERDCSNPPPGRPMGALQDKSPPMIVFGLQDLWLRAGIAPWRRWTRRPPRVFISARTKRRRRLPRCQHVLRRYLDGRPSARRARGAYNARPDPTLRFICASRLHAEPEITTSLDTPPRRRSSLYGMRTQAFRARHSRWQLHDAR